MSAAPRPKSEERGFDVEAQPGESRDARMKTRRRAGQLRTRPQQLVRQRSEGAATMIQAPPLPLPRTPRAFPITPRLSRGALPLVEKVADAYRSAPRRVDRPGSRCGEQQRLGAPRQHHRMRADPGGTAGPDSGENTRARPRPLAVPALRSVQLYREWSDQCRAFRGWDCSLSRLVFQYLAACGVDFGW